MFGILKPSEWTGRTRCENYQNGLTITKHIQPNHWSQTLGSLQLVINCTCQKPLGRHPLNFQQRNEALLPHSCWWTKWELTWILYAMLCLDDGPNDQLLAKDDSIKVKPRFVDSQKGNMFFWRSLQDRGHSFRLNTMVLLRSTELPHDRYFVQPENGRGRSHKVCIENLRPILKLGMQGAARLTNRFRPIHKH